MIGLETVLGCGLAAGLSGLLTYGTPLWIRRREITRLRNLCRTRRTLVLTYDDGPGRKLTPAVLNVLRQFHAPATFFLLGRRAVAAPEVVDQIVAAGHELGCHGQNHPHAWHTAPWAVWADMIAGYRTLERWTGPNAVFRPPYGKTILPVVWRLKRQGTPLGWWTIDSGDTHDLLPAPEAAVEAFRRDGGVMLLHDFDRDPATRVERHAFVLETTRRSLELARQEGLRVVTLSELLANGRHGRRHGAEVLRHVG